MARFLILAALASLAASPVLADPVTLKANPTDDDGRVTLGDIFEGAGAAANVVVAQRAGPSVVFEAGQLQALAARSGLQWSNPRGLMRVVVRNAALAPGARPAAPVEGAAPPAPTVASARRAPAAPRVIARNDSVEVAFVAGGVTLTVTGRALRNAAAGEPVPVLNTASGRTIDAVAAGPGRALAGPGARDQAASPSPSVFAAR